MSDQEQKYVAMEATKISGPLPPPVRLTVDECVYLPDHVVALCVRNDETHLRTVHQIEGGEPTVRVTDEMVMVLRMGQARVWNARTPVSSGAVAEVCRLADLEGLETVFSLIAAQVLRETAEFVRDDESGAFVHGDHCSYGPPGTCDCERGITYRWLLNRARQYARRTP